MDAANDWSPVAPASAMADPWGNLRSLGTDHSGGSSHGPKWCESLEILCLLVNGLY